MSNEITRDMIVSRLKPRAETGFYSGLVRSLAEKAYFERCTFGWRQNKDLGHRLIFTRDIGHHTSGWFKNPDYERCYHLSLSFWIPGNNTLMVPDIPLKQNEREAREWCRLFFGDARRLLWIEPPYSAEGRRSDVYHYRLFCDSAWQPMKPRAEVYTLDFTEKGWKSFSELHADDELRNAVHSMGDPG